MHQQSKVANNTLFIIYLRHSRNTRKEISIRFLIQQHTQP